MKFSASGHLCLFAALNKLNYKYLKAEIMKYYINTTIKTDLETATVKVSEELQRVISNL
jgi:hypothetical protein